MAAAASYRRATLIASVTLVIAAPAFADTPGPAEQRDYLAEGEFLFTVVCTRCHVGGLAGIASAPADFPQYFVPTTPIRGHRGALRPDELQNVVDYLERRSR